MSATTSRQESGSVLERGAAMYGSDRRGAMWYMLDRREVSDTKDPAHGTNEMKDGMTEI